MSHAVAPVHQPVLCPNCTHDVPGEYCGHCGQQRLHEPDVSFPHLLHELWHELAHVDSKIYRTLRFLIARPGLLSQEYFAGRRASYIGPLRLYLIATGFYFLTAAYHPYSASGMVESPMGKEITKLLPELAGYGTRFTAAQLNLQFQQIYSLTLAALVVISALLGWAVLRRRTFGSHLVFNVHTLSASFLMTVVGGVVAKYSGEVIGAVITFGFLIWYEVYRVLAWRRAYDLSWKGSLWREAIVFAVGMVITNIMTIAALVVAVKRLT